jgi:hypothetical protein
MNIKQLKEHAQGIIQNHPILKDEVVELFELAMSEIEEGGSESHECQLAINDMDELVNEMTNENLG